VLATVKVERAGSYTVQTASRNISSDHAHCHPVRKKRNVRTHTLPWIIRVIGCDEL
jgi:hypothetical protein